MPNSKIQAIGLLAAVAVLGFAAGAATMSQASTTAAPTDWRERCSYSSMLKDRLGLTDVQRDSIRAIMRSHRGEMESLIQPVRPQMDSVRAEVRAQVRAVLTPVQQVQYDSIGARERADRGRHSSDTGRARGNK